MKKPKKMTRKDFAQLNGWSPSYVTKLSQAGRLVFTDNNKLVLVKASLAKIKETADPNRDDVAARHKKNRAKPTTKQTGKQKKVNASYSESRAVKEFYASETAKIEHEKLIGKLCDTASALHTGGEAGTIVRALLENLPDQLAPVLAVESEENKVHALMVEYVEQLLHDIADRLNATMAKMTNNEE